MDELTILEIQAKMESGELTARQLTEMYLERIHSLNPKINAVIELNPDALEEAEALDAERHSGNMRGLLHGVPVLLKDNIDTHDKMQTTAGSLALAGSIAKQDAFLVERLRAAGVVLLGKTNLSEWANFRSTRSTSGWSSRGGLTRNPYALDRSACGSSSGSAAAVAANFCAAAIGTETDGSIICPSQTNGVVGIKPTLGLVSRSGIIPIAHSQDTAGPMARTVADAAILLGVMAGADPHDPATASAPVGGADYRSSLDPNGLKGARLGVPRKMAGSDERVLAIFEECITLLKQCGAEIVDPVSMPTFDKFARSEMEVLLYEFKADLNAYLSRLGPEVQVHTLEDVIRFNEENAASVMPYFGQERMLAAQKKGPLSELRYLNALKRNLRLTRAEGLDAALQTHHLDALILPSGGPAWVIDLVNGDNIWDIESTSMPAVAGYPHITVPAGYVFGLPVGLSFIGAAWQESKLIRLAYAFEQAAQVRRPPQFLQTVAL
jgi:amidase